MPRSKESKAVLDFCLEHAESATVARRVLLYRGLAEFCGEESEAREFLHLANDLEAAEKEFREFKFKLSSQ